MGSDALLQENRVYRILVVDDDKDLNEIVCDFMRTEGYELYSALNAGQGIEIAREMKPDIILMDLAMPGLTGLNACEKLNEDDATSGIPVIIVSARCDLKSKLSSYSAGARRYITKPVEFDVLSSEVRRILTAVNPAHDNRDGMKLTEDFLRPEHQPSGI